MHTRKKLLIVRTFFILIFIITMTGCKNGQKAKIDNDKLKPKEQIINKQDEHYDINRNDLKIDFTVDLDNNEQLKVIMYDSFYKYYGIKLPKNEINIFNINRIVDTENDKIIINASYVGEIKGSSYYLSIVINQTKKYMERIDATNYSAKEQEQEITPEQAEKVAEEYLMLVDKSKYKEAGTIKIVKNLREGYQIIFTDKINKNSFITVSVNPHSSQVTSYAIYRT